MKLREIKKKQWWGWAALEKGGMSLWPMGLWGKQLYQSTWTHFPRPECKTVWLSVTAQTICL